MCGYLKDWLKIVDLFSKNAEENTSWSSDNDVFGSDLFKNIQILHTFTYFAAELHAYGVREKKQFQFGEQIRAFILEIQLVI